MAPRRENKSTSLNLIFDPNPKQYEVDSIVNRRILANGKVEYLLKWKQHPDSEKSWEPEDNLDCPELIEKFKNFLKKIENATPMERIQSIVGAARMNNEIFYYVKYTGSEKAEFLPSRFMKKKYPLLIIEFYETRYTEDR